MKTHASERAGKRASKTSEPGEDVRMTQPAKSQEPSMEEILASIRRIIADDDSNKSATRAPEPPKESQPEAPPRPRVDDEARPAKEPSSPLGSAAVADPASDIFDLTEFNGGADAPIVARKSPGRCHAQSRSAISYDRRQFRRRIRRGERKTRRARCRGARTAYLQRNQCGGRFRPSMRSRKPCWCRTPARWRIWCAKCSGRC